MDEFTWLSELFVLGITVGICLYIHFSRKLSYFARMGIPYIPSYPIVGSFSQSTFRLVSFPEQTVILYNKLKGHRFGGMFDFTRPVVMIRDPALLRLVMVKDFDHFVDRNATIPEDQDALLGRSLTSLQGKRWRHMRATLSPAFTSSKMKNMFVFVSRCGDQLGNYLETLSNEKKATGEGVLFMEMKDLWTRYTNDVIATVAFGIGCDSLRDPDNEFYEVGKILTNFGGLRGLVFLGYIMYGRLMKFLRISLFSPRGISFFRTLVHDTIATRERDGIIRPDMIHLLMQARRGELKTEVEDEDKDNGLVDKDTQQVAAVLTDDDITGQALLFFFAGFETTSTLLCFITNRLAVHPDVQRRLQDEIDAVVGEDGNKLTYDGVHRMKYLDMVVSETLRMHPPAVALDRKCVKPYTIPATDTSPECVIEKGVGVWVSVHGLHYDPEYFPEPDKFDPERFSDENKRNIRPFSYIPFGMGPRNCIGMRFALMEVKVALAKLLHRFHLVCVDRTPVEIKYSKKTFNITVDGGFWLGITPRQKA